MKMHDMGMTRGELHGTPAATEPKSEKDYEKEKVYPELNVSGKQAIAMGAEDMKVGDVIEQMVRWRVKRREVVEREDGTKDVNLTLCLEKASDWDDAEGDDDDTEESDGEENEDAKLKPGLAYLLGKG